MPKYALNQSCFYVIRKTKYRKLSSELKYDFQLRENNNMLFSYYLNSFKKP